MVHLLGNNSMSIKEEKARLRESVRAERMTAFHESAQEASQAICHHLKILLKSRRLLNVAGYWAVGSEIDLTSLLDDLDQKGCSVSLPVVVEKSSPLIFRRWHSGDELIHGSFNTLQPKSTCEEIIPDGILVPLLAFDEKKFRLGQGGGFYDRTLQKLKKLKSGVVSIGVAFAAQRVNAVPCDEFDERLDFIVTENGQI